MKPDGLKGRCLCGRVTLALPGRPERVCICNCRFCRAIGAAWGYYDACSVRVAGETTPYTREDLADPWLVAHFCPCCGSTTHYTATPAHPSDRIGVNMRLFDLDAVAGVEVTYQDGRQVETEHDPFPTTATGRMGDGKAF